MESTEIQVEIRLPFNPATMQAPTFHIDFAYLLAVVRQGVSYHPLNLRPPEIEMPALEPGEPVPPGRPITQEEQDEMDSLIAAEDLIKFLCPPSPVSDEIPF